MLERRAWYRRWRFRASDSDEAHNVRYLYLEIVWVAVTTTIISFHSVYAVRLGASDQLVGLLASLPPLIVALMTIPSVHWVERHALRSSLLGSVFVYRLGFLIIALMPFVVQNGRAYALVGIIFLMTIPTPMLTIAFNTIFAELVPERRRAEVVGWRNILLGAGVTVVGYVAGRALDAIAFPLNYQAFYFSGWATSMVGFALLTRLRIPATPARAAPRAAQPLSLTATRALWQANPGFARIVLNSLVYGVGLWMVTPLYSIFYVRSPGASNAWIGLLTSVINASMMLGYFLAQRWVKRWGNRPVLAWRMTGAGVYPILVGLSPALTPILVFGALSGLALSSLNLTHFNTLLKVIPDDRRPSALALYTLLMNVGAFISPLVSVALADRIGIRSALVLGGLCWVASGILFHVRPPEPARPLPRPDNTNPPEAHETPAANHQ